MAKSTRSKWKKLHRRQRAQDEAAQTAARIAKLHRKLDLTVKGGISAVPTEEPEQRFHFLNPELDPRVPNTRKDLNNNYRLELNRVTYDYHQPLQLAPPKTNFYGKSDPAAPHPMTRQFELVDADAPIAGHALTKHDLERAAAKAQNEGQENEQQQNAAQTVKNEEEDDDEDEAASNNNEQEEEEDDGPVEFVFGLEDATPRRVTAKPRKSAKKASPRAAAKKKDTPRTTQGTTSAAAVVLAPRPAKIKSMQNARKQHDMVIATSGASKVKKLGSASTQSSRMVSSGSKKAAAKDSAAAAAARKRRSEAVTAAAAKVKKTAVK